MKSVQDRLNHVFDLSTLSNYQIFRLTTVSEATLSRIRGDAAYNPHNGTISNIARAFGVSFEWIKYGSGKEPDRILIKRVVEPGAVDLGLLEGSGETFITKSGNQYTVVGDNNYRFEVKLVEQSAYAGYLSGWSDPEYIETLPPLTTTVKKFHTGTYRAFEVRGDSMDYDGKRAIENGDIVIAHKIEKDKWTSKLHIHDWPEWVIVTESGIIVKNIVHHDVQAGVIQYRSYNPDKAMHPDSEMYLRDVMELYNVVKVEKNR